MNIKEALPIDKKTIIAATLVVIVVLAIGAYIGAIYFPQYTEKIIEKPAEIKETVRHEVKTVVQYVPKETIIYKDPVTGEQTARKEDTDVEANIGQPAINVKVNGEPHSFSLLQNEKQKFEDGKLVLTQSSDIGIELVVKPQVIDKTKRWSIGIGYGGNGLAGKIDFPLGGNDTFGGWVYGEKKSGAAGVSVKF